MDPVLQKTLSYPLYFSFLLVGPNFQCNKHIHCFCCCQIYRIVINELSKKLNILTRLYFFIYFCLVLFVHLAYAGRTATFLVDISSPSERKVHITRYFLAIFKMKYMYKYGNISKKGFLKKKKKTI